MISLRSAVARPSRVAPSAVLGEAQFARRAVQRAAREQPGGQRGHARRAGRIGDRTAWHGQRRRDERAAGNAHRDDAQPVGEHGLHRQRVAHDALGARRRRRRGRARQHDVLLRARRARTRERNGRGKHEPGGMSAADHFGAPCAAAVAAVSYSTVVEFALVR